MVAKELLELLLILPLMQREYYETTGKITRSAGEDFTVSQKAEQGHTSGFEVKCIACLGGTLEDLSVNLIAQNEIWFEGNPSSVE